MRNQNRLGPLQMGVCRHGRVSRLLGAVHENAEPLRHIGLQLVDASANIEPEVGRNLLIAAAPAVQFVAGIADSCDQLFFDKVMNILRFIILEKYGRGGRGLSNFLQAFENRNQLTR